MTTVPDVRDIEDLGAEIEQAWRLAEYRAEELPRIAQAALAGRALPGQRWVERIFRWFWSAPQIPHQPPHFAFGEPPIQLYAGRRFTIEALFWTDGTTAIHDHGFSGAFQVLLGGSIHTTYRFERRETITPELILGTLVAGRSELLRAGDIRPIASGDRSIHSLFHLERPSLTLVVRTRPGASSGPQYVYRPPGIACDPFLPDERASRLLRLLEVLDPGLPETSELLAELAASADLGSVVVTVLRWFSIHPVDPGTCDALLAIVGRRHRALAASLRAAIHEARRQALIIQRRRSVRHPEHRLFLAMLLNVGDREQILQLVAQQFPGADPIERIMTWVEELVTGNAGAEYDLGEAELKVLHHLLRRRTPEQVVLALGDEYDEVESLRPEILDLCASLARSALFQPLLRGST
jgi:hypothetical protein